MVMFSPCSMALTASRTAVMPASRFPRSTGTSDPISRSAIEPAVPFHIDGHVQSLLDGFDRVAHRRDARIAISPVDGHERSDQHDLAQNWNLEQSLLHHHLTPAPDQRPRDGRSQI